MHVLILVEKNGNGFSKIQEEMNIDKNYLFNLYQKIVPKINQAVLLINKDGGVLTKGVKTKGVKPIISI